MPAVGRLWPSGDDDEGDGDDNGDCNDDNGDDDDDDGDDYDGRPCHACR